VRVLRRMPSRHLTAVTWWGDVVTTVVPMPIAVCTYMSRVRIMRGWLYPVGVVEVSVVRIIVGEVFLRMMGAASRPGLSATHIEVVCFGKIEVRGACEVVDSIPRSCVYGDWLRDLLWKGTGMNWRNIIYGQ
jgi:hypothetical protein